MNDLDQDLREMFQRREADVLGPAAVPPAIASRVLRRQAATVVIAFLSIVALVVAGLGVRAAADRGQIPVVRPTPFPPGVITTVAGTGFPGSSGDGGPATEAEITYPGEVVFDAIGNMYFVEGSTPRRVRKVDPSGQITTVVGTPAGAVDVSGAAALVDLEDTGALAIDALGNLFVGGGDAGNNMVVKVDPSGHVTTVAGTGGAGYAGDGGPAADAQLDWVYDLAFDRQGNLYIADSNNNRVRKVDTNGIITTFAGTGRPGSSGDGGLATKAKIGVTSVCADGTGDILISGDGLVRKIDRRGIITTIAGGGTSSADGIRATRADLGDPEDIWCDGSDLYVADSGANQNRIRRIDENGIITTVAGTGVKGFGGDGGPATDAQLSEAGRVTLGPDGALYIADSANNRIRKVVLDGS
jgi:sugar lactone lactonase YvrE